MTASTPTRCSSCGVAHVESVLDVGPGALGTEHATLEEHAVHADDLVSSALEHRYQHRADVPVMTRDQDLHFHTFHGALPESHSDSNITLSRMVSMHAQKSVWR